MLICFSSQVFQFSESQLQGYHQGSPKATTPMLQKVFCIYIYWIQIVHQPFKFCNLLIIGTLIILWSASRTINAQASWVITMKKISQIIAVKEFSKYCKLRENVREERELLKKTMVGLKFMKHQVGLHIKTLQSVENLMEAMSEDCQSFQQNTCLNEYIQNGKSVFQPLKSGLVYPVSSYVCLKHKCKLHLQKIDIYINQSRLKLQEQDQFIKKLIKEYLQCCFPQLESFLFSIGYYTSKQITKIEDPLKEQSFIDGCVRVNREISDQCQTIRQLTNQTILLGKEYNAGIKADWADSVFKIMCFLKQEASKQNQKKYNIPFKQVEDSNSDSSISILTPSLNYSPNSIQNPTQK